MESSSQCDRPMINSVFATKDHIVRTITAQQQKQALMNNKSQQQNSQQQQQQMSQLFQTPVNNTSAAVILNNVTNQHIHPQIQQLQQQTHILFDLSVIEARDDLDERTQKTYNSLKQLINNKSIKECQELYLKHAASSQQNLEDLTLGLLVTILVDQDGQHSRHYRDIVTFSKDNLNLFSTFLNMIIFEKLPKLKEFSVKQIFWIANQIIKANFMPLAENICSNIMRQIVGGDLTTKNLKLTEHVLELLIENRAWVLNSASFMGPNSIYTFMRLIYDHMDKENLTNLKQRETEFVIGLVKENFNFVTTIGRDFLRLLHYIAKIPEFEKLWHDIYNNPKSLNPNFAGAIQLTATRTPRRLVQSRLTVDMEKKVHFLATQVKFGNHKRYQDWFHKQYFSTPESLSLRCDIIRYICIIIHPSNEVLCSDIIPRWALIGWLLTTCNTSQSLFNSKLTLFYDWLFFDTRIDSIMNIEPGILLMHHSRHSHPNVTCGSLDFLCRESSLFAPKLSDHIKAGIKRSLQQILEKRVVSNINHLAECLKESQLKNLVRENFPEFCSHVNTVQQSTNDIKTDTTSSPLQLNPPPSNLAPTISPSQSPAPSVSPTVLQTNKTHLAQIEIVDIEESGESNETDIATSSHQSNSATHDPQIDQKPSTNETNDILVNDKQSDRHNNITIHSREEMKAFVWNGNEHVNASYSHKQSSDQKTKLNRETGDPFKDSKIKKQLKQEIINYADIAQSNERGRLNNGEINNALTLADSNNTHNQPPRVLYPFMDVGNKEKRDYNSTVDSLEEYSKILYFELRSTTDQEMRCELMDKFLSSTYNNYGDTSDETVLSNLGYLIGTVIQEDFLSKTFPSDNLDQESLEDSLNYPFYVLCRASFPEKENEMMKYTLNLMTSLCKFFDATGFFILYFLRVTSMLSGNSVCHFYVDFCEFADRELPKTLYDDLQMCSVYDSEMFCFMLPQIFGDFSVYSSLKITGDKDLIQLALSHIDPNYLQELICLCLTGNAKVLVKDEVLPILESSLNWESWQQYCLWKLIAAHNVPLSNYVSILSKLDYRVHSEALTSTLLALQKESAPSEAIVHAVLNYNCRDNDHFASSILRYWSMKTEVKELSKIISSALLNATSTVKRKTQTKAASLKNATGLSNKGELILEHLNSVRKRAPKNKLLAQVDILDALSQVESVCSDMQRRKFSDLFAHKPRQAKKLKKSTND